MVVMSILIKRAHDLVDNGFIPAMLKKIEY